MLTVNDRHTFALRRLAEHRGNSPQEQLDEILDAWLALDLEAVDALGQVAELENGEDMSKALDVCITEGHAATMKRAGVVLPDDPRG